MKTVNQGKMAGGFVDINDIVLAYARQFYEKHYQKVFEKKLNEKSLRWDDLSKDIDTSRLIVEHERASYEEEKCRLGITSPRHSVLFKSNYSNTTDEELSYAISTERRTRTSVSLTVTEGFRFGGSFELKCGVPQLEASLGFSSEISFAKGVQTTKEQEITWALNTTVVVPRRSCTTVELVVRDDEYDGRFHIRSFFSGEVHVNLRKQNTILPRITVSNLAQVLTEDLKFKRDIDTGRIYFDTFGACNCRFGVEQDVRTSNSPLRKKET